MQDELIPTTEAARRLGVGVRAVAKMARRGALKPALQLPGETGAMLFAAEDVDRLAAKRGT